MGNHTEIVVVLGTRPEIIKTAPIVRAIEEDPYLSSHVIHSNQHYDAELSAAFFQALHLPTPDTNLGVESGSHAEQTGAAMVGIEDELESQDSPVVLAQGDTNTVLAAAIATSKLPADFGHVEAGIRSFDRTMPEEVNRVLVDHVSDLCFAPSEVAVKNLTKEGISEGVYNTGNTIVDACREHKSLAEAKSDILQREGLSPGEYVVATIHRSINTDDRRRLLNTLKGLDQESIPVVLPCHPRTKQAIDDLRFELPDNLLLIEPLDYLDFLALESNARLIVTDSGGIQEEASILKIPCLTVRPNTERPETIEASVNKLINPEEVERELRALYNDDDRRAKMRGVTDLYGDGNSAERIVQILKDRVG
jgi:UDP-N-acetylglucosamine 2-epimerase (non-hydrolysing)